MATTLPDPEGLSSRSELGSALTTLRQQAGLTVRELARRLQAPTGTIGGYLTGRHLPSAGQNRLFVAMLAQFGVTDPPAVRAWIAAVNRVRASTDRRGRDLQPPFRGLNSYEADDADLFFGRDAETARLLARVRAHPMVVVVGPSGSGKSSVLRAGLVAAVRAGQLDADGLACACALVTPGTEPTARLERALAELAGPGPGVLVVDQLEELFTSRHEVEERQLFLQRLARRDPSVTVVFGLRADFYAQAAREPTLVRALQEAQVLVGPLGPDRVADTILGPAGAVGLTVEPGFVDVVLADLGPAGLLADTQSVSALPLLAHALLTTWERSTGGRLTIADYRRTGGIDAAVEQTAERVYEELSETARASARTLFLRLVTVDDLAVTRRRMSGPELDALATHDGVLDVTRAFIAARLLTAGSDGVEMSHEALLTAWPRLRGWLDDDREALRLHRLISDAAADWDRAGRDPALLQRGVRLESAAGWLVDAPPGLALAGTEREYVEQGLAHAADLRRRDRRTQQRTRQALVAVAVLAVVAVVLAVISVLARGSADRSRRAATAARDDALSRQVAEQAITLAVPDPALAEQLALTAYRVAHTDEARTALLTVASQPIITRVLGATGPTALATTGDGRTIAVGHADDGSVYLYRYRTGAPPTPLGVLPGPGATGQVFALAFSPDGRLLATAGQPRAVTLWDVSDPRHPRRSATVDPAFTGAVQSLAFSPDGRTLAAAGVGPRPVRLWAVRPGSPPTALPGPRGVPAGATVQAVAFDATGTHLAAGGYDGFLRLWPAATASRTAPVTLPTDDSTVVYSLDFAPDGRRLYAGESGGTVRVWSTGGDHGLVHTLTGSSADRTNAVAVSPDGTKVAAGGSDDTLESWDTGSWVPRGVTHNSGPVTGVRWAADSTTLLDTAASGELHLVRLSTGALPTSGSTYALSFSADGTRLAVGTSNSPDAAVQVWDVRRRTAPRPLTPPLRFPDGTTVDGTAALRPDGRLLAAGDKYGRLQLWSLDAAGRARPVRTFADAGELVESLAFAPSGRTLAVASDAHDVTLFDVADPRHPRRLARVGGGDLMLGVAFSPDGRLVAGADADRHAYVWDVADPAAPRRIARLSGFTSYVYGVAFSPDGRLFAATSSDRTARVWSVDGDHRFVLHPPRLYGPTSDAYSASFAPDGHTLAVGSIDGTARVYDVAGQSSVPERTLDGTGGPVFSVAYDPAGGALYSGGGGPAVVSLSTDAGAFLSSACGLVGDPITRVEWAQYVPGARYDPPCR